MGIGRRVMKAASFARARRAGLAGARLEPECKVRIDHGTAIAAGAVIRRGVHIAVMGSAGAPASLVIGRGSFIGARTRINCTTSITIGDGVEISWLCQVLDSDFHQIFDEAGAARPPVGPVVIEDHVLIGTGVIITKGVTIGRGSVVGAGSVVTKDVPAGVLAAGNPARPLRKISGWR